MIRLDLESILAPGALTGRIRSLPAVVPSILVGNEDPVSRGNGPAQRQIPTGQFFLVHWRAWVGVCNKIEGVGVWHADVRGIVPVSGRSPKKGRAIGPAFP